MATKTRKTKKVRKKSNFVVLLKQDPHMWKSEGDTLVEALEKLLTKEDRFKIKAKCLITVNGNTKTLTPLQAKRIQNSKMFREMISGKLLNKTQ